tara:strand:- start:105 stop:293 length:189 start_codon:yes stop_codon:yes gene_type:complete
MGVHNKRSVIDFATRWQDGKNGKNGKNGKVSQKWQKWQNGKVSQKLSGRGKYVGKRHTCRAM